MDTKCQYPILRGAKCNFSLNFFFFFSKTYHVSIKHIQMKFLFVLLTEENPLKPYLHTLHSDKSSSVEKHTNQIRSPL